MFHRLSGRPYPGLHRFRALRIHSRRCLPPCNSPGSLTGSSSPIFFTELRLMIALFANKFPAVDGKRVFSLLLLANHALLGIKHEENGSISWPCVRPSCIHEVSFVEFWKWRQVTRSRDGFISVVVGWCKALTWLAIVFVDWYYRLYRISGLSQFFHEQRATTIILLPNMPCRRRAKSANSETSGSASKIVLVSARAACNGLIFGHGGTELASLISEGEANGASSIKWLHLWLSKWW